jgi:hypothetical protein
LNKSKRVVFSVPVWGEEYIKNFLEFSIPSMLARRNIPFLVSKNCVVVVNIYTSQGCIEILETSDVFKKLKTLTTVYILTIDIRDRAY